MDDSRLCSHLSKLFSEKVPQRSINIFVQRCISLDNASHFVEAMKALSLSLKHWQNGNPSAFDYVSQYFQLKNIYWEGSSKGGPVAQPLKIPNSLFIGEALEYCRQNPEEADKLLAGMMKLHSVEDGQIPSQSKCDSIRESITSPGPELDGHLVQQFREICDRWCYHYLQKQPVMRREYMTLSSHPANPKKMSYNPVKGQSTPRNDPTQYYLGRFLSHRLIAPLMELYPDEFISHLYTGEEISTGEWQYQNLFEEWDGPLGSISMIPEPGGKIRTVAVPSIGLLSLNYPLSRFLHGGIRETRTQGVRSHDRTATYLQGLIDGKRTFHSKDMTSFTDRFPYELQRVLLESMVKYQIITEFDLEIQDLVCSVSYDFRRDPVLYEVGTPQGSYGSFPLASLSHGLLAALSYEIANGVKVNPLDDLPFRVIGDDIVIYDSPTNEVFTNLMVSLGVEISLDKSLDSTQYIEMCSKWISSYGVFFQKKVKPIDSPAAYIKAYQYYGGQIEELPQYDYLHYLPQPFGVLEENPDDPVTILSTLSQAQRALKSGVPMKDFNILHRRRPNPRYLLNVTSERDHKERRSLTPFSMSILRDIDYVLDKFNLLVESGDLNSLDNLTASPETQLIYKTVIGMSELINELVSQNTGPSVLSSEVSSTFSEKENDRLKAIGLNRRDRLTNNTKGYYVKGDSGENYSYSPEL